MKEPFDRILTSLLDGHFDFVNSEIANLRSKMEGKVLPYGVYKFAGLAYYFSGDYAGAIREYRRALANDPDCVGALSDLAYLLACCPDDQYHDVVLAVELSTKAVELTSWQNWMCVQVLASAHARAGDYEHAESCAKIALKLANPSNRKRTEDLLELITKHQPYVGNISVDYTRWRDEFRQKYRSRC